MGLSRISEYDLKTLSKDKKGIHLIIKSLLRRFKVELIYWLVFCIYWVIGRTYRLSLVGQEHLAQASKLHAAGSYCLLLWHEFLLTGIFSHEGQGIVALISSSKDGDLATRLAKAVGFDALRGSSSAGAVQALLKLNQELASGSICAITVDGPLGPRRIPKTGALRLARDQQVALVPLGFHIDRSWRLKTWDRFCIPKPFAKIEVRYGEPQLVAENASKEELVRAKMDLARRLNDLNPDVVIQDPPLQGASS